jgi:hypothetical protein
LRWAHHGAACAPSAHSDAVANRITATVMVRMNTSVQNCVTEIFGSGQPRWGLNAQCEQFNHADPDHQHCECYGIVVEPMPPLCVHDTPPYSRSLVGVAGRRVQMWRVGAPGASSVAVPCGVELKYGTSARSGSGDPDNGSAALGAYRGRRATIFHHACKMGLICLTRHGAGNSQIR